MISKLIKIVSLISVVFADDANKKKTIDGPVIGIDLGTTYSCVGIFKNGRVEIIPNGLGNRITPSYVAFTDEEKLVGEAAKNQASVNPERTIFVIKRLIGRNFDDKEVQRDMKYLPYNIVSKSGDNFLTICYEKMAPLFVECIKALKKEINELREEVAELRERA